MELLQFSAAANFPILIIRSAFSDIINFLCIYGIMIIGEMLSGYLLFGMNIAKYSNLHESGFTIWQMIMGAGGNEEVSHTSASLG